MAKYGKPNRIQIKALLEYMGVPLNQQPGKIVDALKLLDLSRLEKPERYENGYSVIVRGMDPADLGREDDKELYDAKKIVDIVSEHFDDKFNKASRSIDYKVQNATKELEDRAMEIAKHAIAEAAKQFTTIAVKVGSNKPRKVDGVVPEWFPQMLQLAQARKNILLVGPAGCGKTHMASILAQALGLDYSSQSCSAGMSESQLTGWLLPVGDDSRFVYVMAEFVRIYENGGVFLIDEIDSSDPNVLIYINQALAQKEFYLPHRYENPRVKKHKDFVAVAAANTFGTGADAMYHARNALDAATLDRFRIGVIPVDYSPTIEEKFVNTDILEWGRDIRDRINRNHLQKIMSTRFLIDATDMNRDQEWNLDQIKSSYFADWSKEEMRMIGVAL